MTHTQMLQLAQGEPGMTKQAGPNQWIGGLFGLGSRAVSAVNRLPVRFGNWRNALAAERSAVANAMASGTPWNQAKVLGQQAYRGYRPTPAMKPLGVNMEGMAQNMRKPFGATPAGAAPAAPTPAMPSTVYGRMGQWIGSKPEGSWTRGLLSGGAYAKGVHDPELLGRIAAQRMAMTAVPAVGAGTYMYGQQQAAEEARRRAANMDFMSRLAYLFNPNMVYNL